MNDLSENINLERSFDLSPADEIIEQSQPVYNGSINGTLLLFNKDLEVNNNTMRLLFITLAIIIVLVCITISTILFICICLNRRRNIKHEEKQDHPLLLEQPEKILHKKISIKDSSAKNLPSNTNQSSTKINLPSLSNMTTEKIPIGPYYDNLDDIPFIDESRPTSFIDITRVQLD